MESNTSNMKDKVYVPTANENEFVAFGRNTGKTYESEMNIKEVLKFNSNVRRYRKY